MRISRFATICSLALLALSNPRSAARADDAPRVADSASVSISDDSSDTLATRHLTFPKPLLAAVYDSASQVVVVACRGTNKTAAGGGQGIISDKTWAENVAYDLARRRVLWANQDPGNAVGILGDCVVTSNGTEATLRRIADGEKVADLEGRPLFDWRNRRLFALSEHTVTHYDPASGEVLWRVDRGGVTGPARCLLRGGRLVIGAAGVQVIEVASGSTWTYPLPASRPEVYTIGGNLGYINGRTMGSLFGGDRVVGLGSAPMLRDGRIYFAAETTVVCLGLESGQCYWRRDLKSTRRASFRERAMGQPLGPQFLGRLVIRNAGDRIVVASLGWMDGKDRRWLADPPTIAFFSKEDGRLIRRIGVDGSKVLEDVEWTTDGVFALASDRIVVMDDSLVVQHVVTPPADFFELFDFFPSRRPIVAVATAGVLAFAPESTRVSWQRKMGVKSFWWFGADQRDDSIEAGFEAPPHGDYLWLASTQRLQGFDPENGYAPAISYPLPNASDAAFHDHTVVIRSGRMLSLVPLPKRSR